MLKILLTGVGGPGTAGTVQALRDNPDNRKVYLIGVDADKDAVGQHFVDKFFPISLASDKENYLRDLLHASLFSADTEADVILPANTCELETLAKNKAMFEERGIAVAVSSPESIRIANNKWLLSQIAADNDIPTPKNYLATNLNELRAAVEALGYPEKKVIVKPPIASGSRGLRILTDEIQTVGDFLSTKPEIAGMCCSFQELIKILRNGEWPEVVVSEYLPGPEWSVDCYRDERLNVAIPRIRSKMRSGISFDTQTDLREDIIEYSTKISKALNMEFAFGHQFKADAEGIPRLIEANPRIQGTMIAGCLAGFNMIYYSAVRAVSPATRIPPPKKIAPVRIQRYWGFTSK